ncbi:MAG: AAA family ATPase [Candidatus Enteromonas sp.]|nr:AAA family ATPase [Candidatus Enteromonas sp.]
MNHQEIQNELLQVRKEIAELPSGYISKKNINGKTRYYLQWVENGKKKSKYFDDVFADDLRAKIEKRRELQKREKELVFMLPKPQKAEKKEETKRVFKTEVMLGESLKSYVQTVANYKKRNLYKGICDYIYGDVRDKVLILYGLRRTGKTTLIRQVMAEMNDEDFSKTAFIQVGVGIGLSDINQDLKHLMNGGYKYVFIDEVTLIKDFIEGAALFSDIFAACGMKIVLSGTDSLGFFFSEDEQLYDRCIFLHTTFIPYREFEEVLGIKGIDEYICYGGTMSLGGVHYNERSTFANKKSVDEYVDSAIAKNIQHSLKYYQYGGHFRALYDLYEKNELTSAINRVVEDVNHRFTLDVLTKDFISHDLGVSAKNLRNDKQNSNDILDRIDKEEFTKRLKNLLEIRNKEEQTVTISEDHRREIKEYLDALDLTVDIDIQTLPVGRGKNFKTVFTQPGMRYSQAKELVQSLLEDGEFQALSIDERNAVIERILSDIKGRMMEDIVLLETKIANPKKQVFQLQFAVGEFDMVVADNTNATCEIYEVKHSKEQAKEQYRHLMDEEKLKSTAFRYGKIIKKVVIYRGENTTLDNGIEYRNVEEYLKSLV